MVDFLNAVDSFLYYPILLVVLVVGGLYFTVRTEFVQIRLFKEACRMVVEKPENETGVSSFQALMVSTASRVGTGNIVGVSTAICLGGPGAVFWMWIMAIVGASSAFIESTLAQIYKRKDKDGSAYGGPAYYIQHALGRRGLAMAFCVFLILTYAFGFNLLASYNLQSTFAAYSFYETIPTPEIVGLVLAVLVGYCLFGGGKRIVNITTLIVPVMGIAYILIALIVILMNFENIPTMFTAIFADAFDFKSIFGGMAGSCMIYGIKRGLYSNEAGVGSAPNASASAMVSHPVKQGLVQTISVYIDTVLICTATGLMCLSSGVEANEVVSGAPYVQNAISTVFGTAGPIFITVAMILFAFTTLLGNLYYVDNALIFMNGNKRPSKAFMSVFHLVCAAVVFAGSIMPMEACWALADITMGGMTLINIPTCMILGGVAIKACKDYEKQLKEDKDPVFIAKNIGMDDSKLDFWK